MKKCESCGDPNWDGNYPCQTCGHDYDPFGDRDSDGDCDGQAMNPFVGNVPELSLNQD